MKKLYLTKRQLDETYKIIEETNFTSNIQNVWKVFEILRPLAEKISDEVWELKEKFQKKADELNAQLKKDFNEKTVWKSKDEANKIQKELEEKANKKAKQEHIKYLEEIENLQNEEIEVAMIEEFKDVFADAIKKTGVKWSFQAISISKMISKNSKLNLY